MRLSKNGSLLIPALDLSGGIPTVILTAILSINYGVNVTLVGGLVAYLIALLTVAASPALKVGPQLPPAEF